MKRPHSVIAVAAFLVVAFTSARTCEADTVELKTGQRIDGEVKSVTSTDVVLDVAGQPLTIARAKVSAIYYGVRPPTTSPAAKMSSPLKDALRVLKGLQSATSAGISYRDYAPRVTDAKIQVDRMLDDAPDGTAKVAMAEALGFYVFAAHVWNVSIYKSNFESIAADLSLERCLPLKEEVERFERPSDTPYHLSVATNRGITIAAVGVNPLLSSCVCHDHGVLQSLSLAKCLPASVGCELNQFVSRRRNPTLVIRWRQEQDNSSPNSLTTGCQETSRGLKA